MSGRDDDGGMRVIPLKLRGEPQAVVARHHHIDDRQVVMMSAQRGECLIGVGRGLGSRPSAVTHRAMMSRTAGSSSTIRTEVMGSSVAYLSVRRSQDYCHGLNGPICL